MATEQKPKVAFYWCASCGGCEEAVVDLAEAILDVVQAVDIVLWPVALDFKKKDVEALADGSIAVSFINGAVRLSEQEQWAHLLRRKSQLVVAFGACAHRGGIPGLANLFGSEDILETAFLRQPSVDNPDACMPETRSRHDGATLELPVFSGTVRALDQVIDVDYSLPGCPPTPALVHAAVVAILEGKLPAKGAVLCPNEPLCRTCPREASRPEQVALSSIRRVGTATPEPGVCLLASGFVCLGPVTRTGCGETCIRVNMPCRGCFGPPDGLVDPGASFLSALATSFSWETPEELARLVDQVPDPAGTFYRYGLPKSLLGRRFGGGEK